MSDIVDSQGRPVTKELTPWERFCFDLTQAVWQCTETGVGARLSLGGKHEVTIDIYTHKSQVKKLDKMSNKKQAEKIGMKVVEGGKKENQEKSFTP